MLNILIKRILIAIPVLLVVASLTFFFIRLAPGGPFDADKVVSPQVMKNLNAAYNLDAPLHEQYFDYMSGVVVGDFGPSFKYPGRSVTELIMSGLPTTIELAIYSILFAIFFAAFSAFFLLLNQPKVSVCPPKLNASRFLFFPITFSAMSIRSFSKSNMANLELEI